MLENIMTNFLDEVRVIAEGLKDKPAPLSQYDQGYFDGVENVVLIFHKHVSAARDQVLAEKAH